MDGADVGVVEDGFCPGFLEEPGAFRFVGIETDGEEFQGDRTCELEIFSFIDDTHAAFAEFLEDSVVRNRLSYHGEPTPVCMIPAARKTSGTAAIYGGVSRESTGCY